MKQTLKSEPMIKNYHKAASRARCFMRSFAYTALLCIISLTASAQANYLSVFGAPSSGCTSATDNNKMKATTSSPTAASLSGIAKLDNLHKPSGDPFFAASSVYNSSGQIAFSVDQMGIYNPNGSTAFDFSDPALFSVTVGGSIYDLTPQWAISEICTFPVGANNNSYYAVFWAFTRLGSGTNHNSYCCLRAVKIDIDASGGLHCTDNVLYDETTDGMVEKLHGSTLSSYNIAADAACGTGRDVYTSEQLTGPGGYGSTIRKWVFPANGSLPAPTTATFFSSQYCPAYTAKAKILNISTTVGTTVTTKKYYSFITGDYTGPSYAFHAHSVAMVNISDPPVGGIADIVLYHVGPTASDIHGFENVHTASADYVYASYTQSPFSVFDPVNSGLAFFDAIATGTNTTYTHVSSTGDYAYTDLELSKGGDLLMVNGTPSVGPTVGNMAYLSAGGFGLASAAPTVITGTCSGAPQYYNVSNTIGGSGYHYPFYLGKQIIGEDYTVWSGGAYTVGVSETWTTTTNPYGPGSVIYMGDIVIPAGHSLTISGLTVKMAAGSHIDVNEAATSSSPGGRLALTGGTILTNNPSSCIPGNDLWGGVRVFGKSSYSQNGTNTPQGLISIVDATISYAQYGISSGQMGPVYWGVPSSSRQGGVINALFGKFINNSTGILYCPYKNFDPSDPTTEIGNASRLQRCDFATNDATSVAGSAYYGIYGYYVKGVNVLGCQFTNSLAPGTTNTAGAVINSYGIYAVNMGFNVANFTGSFFGVPFNITSTFSNYVIAINHVQFGGSNTPDIRNSTFTNNVYGINFSGSQGPLVTGNRFYIPDKTVSSGGIFTTVGIRSVGIVLNTANHFGVFNNGFLSMTTIDPKNNWTVGIDATNTGGDDNIINANTFVGLGAGNLAHFKNNNVSPTASTLNYGLYYLCNANIDNRFDISAVGHDVNYDGIRVFQGYPSGSAYAGYPYGLPAGNTFTYSTSPLVLNLSNSGCVPYNYYFATSSSGYGDPMEEPGTGNTSITKQVPPVQLGPIDAPPYCPPYAVESPHVIRISQGMNLAQVHIARVNNINFYANDTAGIPHRDSLYYWVGYKRTPYTDLLMTNMLVEDSLIDSANIVYDNILTSYELNEVEVNEFAYGRRLMNIVIANRVNNYGNIGALDTAQVDSLRDIATNTKMWAHVRAAAWLYELGDTTIKDTLMFPEIQDPTPPGPNGVLAVTEISNGPSGNCEYAEMIVANCSEDTASTVNISGWIIDDNAGLFNKNGCGVTNITASTGHFRFAQSALWTNVPVGSIIVVYNRDANCYNLGNDIRIDTTETGIVYRVPIGGSLIEPYGKHMERHLTLPNVFQCNYCSEDEFPYQTASGWASTIGLDNSGDGFQVRCPGCSDMNPDAPSFYHGIGYGPSSGLIQYRSVAAGPDDLGAPVKSGSGGNSKYVFTGATKADLGNPSMWSKVTADAAGSIPSSLGNVNASLRSAVVGHTLGLPCCSNVLSRSATRAANSTTGVDEIRDIQDISVYPNPANTALYFQFPASGKTTISLMDISGRVMNEQVLENKSGTFIDLNGYTPGIYLYQVITNGETKSGKVSIEK